MPAIPLVEDYCPPRPSVHAATSRILFALDRSEWERFFPKGAAGLAASGRADYCDVGTLAEAAVWREQILRIRPSIIVSAWRTPAITDELTRAAGGPVDYVCHVAGSVRQLVTRAQIEAGLIVSNWGSLVAPIVAEHTLLLVLAGLRNLPAWRGVLGWPDHLRRERLTTRCLRGKRVAIHGFGAIARELIALLNPFGVSIHAYSSGVPLSFMQEYGVHAASSLEGLCAGADVFVTCEALTPATHGVIDAKVLARLPEGAVFVNVGRGRLVDEHALLRIAREKHLRVASDVFVNEPIAPDSPFVGLPDALISPHIGGPTDDLYPMCGDYALANVNRHLAGQAIESLVTLTAYDRST
ncbi:hydroxyacid dehydrogenase [Geminisphaera colitermitum]|uniref:hydroxyacid dehydrogenase n=1 Tax=Geminisphaera colitermitum TaxID=1148786 RepID=UPI000158CF59|nr:hydroxyacid dehydrogenase [Geminisphaera colitermitum]